MKGSVAKKCQRDASASVFEAIRGQLGVLVDEIKDEKRDPPGRITRKVGER